MDEHQENLIRCFRLAIRESKQLSHREVQLRRIIYTLNVRDPELIREFLLQLHNQLENQNLLHFL